jgi:hypothetical protein
MSSAIQQLAAQLARLERELRSIATTPALAYSSIEDGGSIDSNADSGGTMAQFGGQFDGSFMAASLVGPTPPTPSAPIVTAAIGGLTVRWDGEFADALHAPMDFTRVEFQVSTDAGFDALSAATLAATVETPRGASLFIPRAPGVYYVAFVARSQSGAAGPKSATSGAVTVTLIGNDALTNPTAFDSGAAAVFNFALSTASASKASITLLIPAGFTRALVHCTVDASVQNSSAAFDYFYVGSQISAPGVVTITGGQAFEGLNPGQWASAGTSGVADYSGLTPGSSITVQCHVHSNGSTWAAVIQNTANVHATVTFLR